MEHTLICTGHQPRYERIVKAENCGLRSADGETYLDLESGIWSTGLGHGNARINAAISRQLSEVVHTGYCWYHPVVDEAAASVLEATGLAGGKALFLSSGSEAVEFSIALARSCTGRRRVLTMVDSYLGAFGLAGSRGSEDWILYDWESPADVEAIPFQEVAAFVFEPGSSSGLVRFPPEGRVATICERVRRSGGLLVANEVTTGLGRTGKWFGHQHYDFRPDVVALGKGLGNGYPVSAVAVSAETVGRLAGGSFHHGQSHQNDALGAAVAKEVIATIRDEGLVEKARADGEYTMEGLYSLGSRYGRIKEVRGRGLMIAVEFERDLFQSCAGAIAEELHRRRIILTRRPGLEVLRLDPALTIAREDLARFLEAFEEGLRRLK